MSRQLGRIILNRVTTKLSMLYEQNWTKKVSIDGKTDSFGSYVVNEIIVEMNEENSSDIFLLNCGQSKYLRHRQIL